MSMICDSSQSPRAGGGSPQKLHSAWAQVVRGDSESPPPPNEQQSTFSDHSPVKTKENSDSFDSINVEKPKKLAWNTSNGLTDMAASLAAPAVMGAVSWPALSESTKPSNKSTPSAADSSSDGSIASTQVPVTTHKQTSTNAKSNTSSNHSIPTRQRSMKHGGGGSASSGVGHSHSQSNFSHPSPPPTPPPQPTLPVYRRPANGYGNTVPPMLDHSPRDPSYRGNNNWEPRPVGGFVTPPPVVNDNHRPSPRRGNFGSRGDGNYHNSFGGRRDQDRGHHGHVRDAPVQQQRSPRGFVRPPPANTNAFVSPPQPVGPFPNPIYPAPDMLYIPPLPLEPYRGVMPFMAHAPAPAPAPAPALIIASPEPPLPSMLVYQIEYYFSDANLIKDEFLKSNMDDQGWVSIKLIAGFNRVKNMTKDIQLILASLRNSTVLEVDAQEDKVRRRNDWMKWIPGSSRLSADSVLQNSFQKMTVEEAASNQISMTANPLPNPEDPAAPSAPSESHSQFVQQGTKDSNSS